MFTPYPTTVFKKYDSSVLTERMMMKPWTVPERKHSPQRMKGSKNGMLTLDSLKNLESKALMGSLFEHSALLSDLCLTERQFHARPGIRCTKFTPVPLLLESNIWGLKHV